MLGPPSSFFHVLQRVHVAERVQHEQLHGANRALVAARVHRERLALAEQQADARGRRRAGRVADLRLERPARTRERSLERLARLLLAHGDAEEREGAVRVLLEHHALRVARHRVQPPPARQPHGEALLRVDVLALLLLRLRGGREEKKRGEHGEGEAHHGCDDTPAARILHAVRSPIGRR
jgi:hypothetical protein